MNTNNQNKLISATNPAKLESVNKPIQIFKAGKHTASSGQALTFSESDLTASANAYDPAVHEAPLVIGHPKTDGPAYGWVKSLSFSDSGLEANPDQINADFAEMVKNGSFKKISASFYTPESKSNPVPGVYYLRHVGFLGAEPPAIKGLRAPEFSDAADGVVEFSELNFNGYDDMTVAKLFRRVREWFVAEKGVDVADRVLPDYEISGLEMAANQEIVEDRIETQSGLNPIFNEGNTMSVEDKARLADLEAENAKLKQQQADFAEAQTKARRDAAHADNLAFAEGLVKAGQLLPAQKDAVVATLNYVAAPAEAVEFGEGAAKQPLLDALKAALTINAKLVDFGEHKGGSENASHTQFSAPSGYAVDQTNLELHQKAVEFAEANNTSYEVALSKVS